MSDNGVEDVAIDPVVIVGMAVEAPGGIDTADSYWDLLAHGREALGPFPTDRAGPSPNCSPGHAAVDSNRSTTAVDSQRGSHIRPRVLRHLASRSDRDGPTAAGDAAGVPWRALENSGINPDDLAGHDVGCFVGASMTGYGPEMAEFSRHSGHLLAGTALSVISGRVAYTLRLTGPALTLDSSCASALVAFHVAVRALRDGDCDLALAGGVNVLGSPGFFVEFSKQHALSDDGYCRPYSAQASGTVWAEDRQCLCCNVNRRRCGPVGRSSPKSAPPPSTRTVAVPVCPPQRGRAGPAVPPRDHPGRNQARGSGHD